MPAATEPRDFRIALSLKAALQAIAVSAGYYYDVEDAAVKLDAEQGVEALVETSGPRPYILIELREDARQHHPSNQIEYERTYTIHWVHDPAPLVDALLGEPTPPQDEDRVKVFERGIADVEKAVSQDSSRGGLAVDTRVEAVRWNALNAGQRVWAEIDVTVRTYREYGVTV